MLAIQMKDFELWGCPNCGCDFAVAGNFISYGTSTGTCEECKLEFMIVPNTSKIGDEATVGIGRGNKQVEYPRIISHPRKGIIKHSYEWPDPRPEGGGEYWQSRGIGYDLSGFVKSKKAGERILEMVKEVLKVENPASWLDYRPREPKWIQFKFQKEEFDLEKLDKLAEDNNNILTIEILKECCKPVECAGEDGNCLACDCNEKCNGKEK